MLINALFTFRQRTVRFGEVQYDGWQKYQRTLAKQERGQSGGAADGAGAPGAASPDAGTPVDDIRGVPPTAAGGVAVVRVVIRRFSTDRARWGTARSVVAVTSRVSGFGGLPAGRLYSSAAPMAACGVDVRCGHLDARVGA